MTHAQVCRRDPALEDLSALDATFDWAGRGFTTLVRARKRLVAYVLPERLLQSRLLSRFLITSTATFIAQGSGTVGLPVALQSAAASLGLDKGNDYSPKFYADLLSSRPVLSSAILRAAPEHGAANHDHRGNEPARRAGSGGVRQGPARRKRPSPSASGALGWAHR